MPTAALRPCTHPGCTQLVQGGRCAKHQVRNQPEIRARKRLYDSAAWKRIRRAQLARQPWCEECLKENRYTPARQVDHITPHEGDPVKFFAGPFQSLCDHHHSQKTAREVGWGGAQG